MSWNPTESERSEHGVRPDARFPAQPIKSYQGAGAPLDKEGIPFLSANGIDSSHGTTMGQIIGRSSGNAKRVAWETDAPQYIERRGQSQRVWYSLGEVKNWVGSKRAAGSSPEQKAQNESQWGPWHNHLTKLHEGLTAANEVKRKNGEPVGDYYNQTHRDHKNIHLRMEEAPGGRPNVSDSEDSPQGIQVDAPRPGARPDLNKARLHGFVNPSRAPKEM